MPRSPLRPDDAPTDSTADGRADAGVALSASGPGGAAAAPLAGRAKRVQMVDIARLAGVSTATVSRALSGSPLIQKDTRDRIHALAAALNYRVNAGAASLRRQEVSTLGVAMLDANDRPPQTASDPFMMTLVGSLADAVSAHGRDMLLARYGLGQVDRLFTLAQTGRVAGLILIGHWAWHDHLNELVRRGVAVAVWGAAMPGMLYPTVGSDNEQGGYLAAHHLLDQGCRSVAFLGDLDHPEAALRHAGYRRALLEAGHVPNARWQRPVLFGAPDLQTVVADWVQMDAIPDGVVVSSDLAAMGLIRALASHGLRVPEDVRVVGYDDIPLAEHVHPSLTTIRQSMQTAGPALVQMLLDRLQGVMRPSMCLPAELVVRESSGARPPVDVQSPR
jgi:DNA-binding LacI/PurR family transcriptional regulator